MNRIDPKTFTGPRAYFTAFDYRILDRLQDFKTLEYQVERKLKLLLLIKSQIVCAASHLTSDFAFGFFRKNTELLRTGSIIPALRSDKKEIDDLFDPNKQTLEQEKIRFYRDNVSDVVSWRLEENTEWFRDRFVEELSTSDSVVRKTLRDLSEESLNAITTALATSDVLSRQQIGEIAEQLPETMRPVLLNFRELLYHISGARVVNCESSLPQENYIDYDITDLNQRRLRLSDDQILWKLFIELALESFQRRLLPIELLDQLTFDDILRVRAILIDSGFQSDYDALINAAIPQTDEGKNLRLVNIDQLEAIRVRLENTFESVFQTELPSLFQKRAITDAKELGDVSASVALGFAGLIPGIGTFSSIGSILKESRALYMNIAQVHRSMKSLDSAGVYVQHRNEAIKSAIERMDISEKSTMLDMVDMLTALISERIKL